MRTRVGWSTVRRLSWILGGIFILNEGWVRESLADFVAPPSCLTYSNYTAPQVFTVGKRIVPMVPSSGGGRVEKYKVIPNLPAGILINSKTGVISGNPINPTPQANYIVTASNISGSASVALNLTVRVAASQAWSGTKQVGSGLKSKSTYGSAITTDSWGNVILVGYTNGGLEGNKVKGDYDLFVTKYNASGVKLWTKQMGMKSVYTIASDVVTDAEGNIFVIGNTNGRFEENYKYGKSDFFLIKFNSAGVKQWSQQFGATYANADARAVKLGEGGNIYVAGNIDQEMDGNKKGGKIDLFLVKFNPSGQKLWTQQLGGPGDFATIPTDMVIRHFDWWSEVYIVGYTQGALDGQQRYGNQDSFLVKYDAEGRKQWTKLWGASGESVTWGNGISIDRSGIYVSGTMMGGTGDSNKVGATDLFLTHFDATGEKLWEKRLGVPLKYTWGQKNKVDSNGNIYVIANTDTGIDGNVLTGKSDTLLVKYNSSGEKQWIKQFGAPASSVNPAGLTIDANGGIFIGGVTDGGLDGNSLSAEDSRDYFITKFNSLGVKQ